MMDEQSDIAYHVLLLKYSRLHKSFHSEFACILFVVVVVIDYHESHLFFYSLGIHLNIEGEQGP